MHIPSGGVYVCSAKLTRERGHDVFFRIYRCTKPSASLVDNESTLGQVESNDPQQQSGHVSTEGMVSSRHRVRCPNLWWESVIVIVSRAVYRTFRTTPSLLLGVLLKLSGPFKKRRSEYADCCRATETHMYCPSFAKVYFCLVKLHAS